MKDNEPQPTKGQSQLNHYHRFRSRTPGIHSRCPPSLPPLFTHICHFISSHLISIPPSLSLESRLGAAHAQVAFLLRYPSQISFSSIGRHHCPRTPETHIFPPLKTRKQTDKLKKNPQSLCHICPWYLGLFCCHILHKFFFLQEIGKQFVSCINIFHSIISSSLAEKVEAEGSKIEGKKDL